MSTIYITNTIHYAATHQKESFHRGNLYLIWFFLPLCPAPLIHILYVSVKISLKILSTVFIIILFISVN